MNRAFAKPDDASAKPVISFDGVDLVIFDFDGVIADSEPISLGTLADTLAAFGIDMQLAEVRDRFLGTSLATITDFVQHARPGSDKDEFAHRWQDALFARFRESLTAIPRVGEMLDLLDGGGIAYCIASSGTFERIGIALEAIQLTHRFEHVFSAEKVARGKPAPDLFLHAAQTLGVSPGACLVIEDSPFGIRAATSAGMASVGFVGGAHLKDVREGHAALMRQKGAKAVITGYTQLFPALTR